MDTRKLRACFVPRAHEVYASASLFVMRFVVGLAFMFHGWGKIQAPFDWMGSDSSTPALFQLLAAVSEFGGGLAWILGLLVPLASLGIFSTMVVATYSHMIIRGDPFVGHGGPSFELALVYLSVSLVLLAVGPGRFSLDAFIFKRK